jgi:single stranded DNA-binding protein
MSLVNNSRLIGYCGCDPELSQTKNNIPMLILPIYTKSWRKNQQQEMQFSTQRHRCIFYGNNALRANKLLMKGQQVHIEGSLQYYEYQVNGQTFSLAQIVVDEFMLSTKAMMTKELYQHIFSDEEIPYTFAIYPDGIWQLTISLYKLRNQFSEEEIALVSPKMEIIGEGEEGNAAVVNLNNNTMKSQNDQIIQYRFNVDIAGGNKIRISLEVNNKRYFEKVMDINSVILQASERCEGDKLCNNTT